MSIIPQPQKQKSCRRQTQCSSKPCGCLCTQPIWCRPLQPFYMRYFGFISDQKSCCCFCACHNSKMNFIPQPQEEKSCRRQTQCSNTLFGSLCGCLCIQPIWCCPLQPFYYMRYFVVHFDQKSCYLCAYHISKTIFTSTTGREK